MQTITLGDVEITRIVEWQGPVAPASAVFPDTDPEKWARNASWLSPDFWDPETGDYLAHVQTWVLRSAGRTILVDTGIGNDKERPRMPFWSHLNGDFLDRLATQADVRPEDVDLVVNTHVHTDHVGWNTRLQDGAWVPAFPRATYLIPRADFDYWNPRNGIPKHGSFGNVNADRGNRHMFEDSVDPVHRSGQALLWEGGHRIDGALALEPAPGHTPGSSVLRLTSGTDRALFVGDLLHSPLQITEPDEEPCLSEDPRAATATRRRYLEQAAGTNSLVFPAHLPGHGAAEIGRQGTTGFSIKKWAPFTP